MNFSGRQEDKLQRRNRTRTIVRVYHNSSPILLIVQVREARTRFQTRYDSAVYRSPYCPDRI